MAIQAAREEERVRKSLEESKRFYEVPNEQQNGKTQNKKPSAPCFHCGKMGHWARDCRSQQSTSISGNSANHPPKATVITITCRYCKKPGNTKEVCRKLKYVNSKKGIETSENVSKTQGNQSQSYINGGRSASSIKTAAISFQNSS
ncbi:CCHC-type domain-containing protein [Aphis craccivora]|uniref:CCHC-type domain-containing protein n=1 Tax=Aphis craccivora TaxID=307492 RepID=A0A6G0Y5R1_APHCR|nr:CCHC-type domain-containing protein [Aphis craccivora]